MKLLIAVVLILLWLFFPVKYAVRWWRRWQAKREAANYSRTLLK
jgi:cbb3-type cytochrome oxidase subunit 3